MATAACLNNSSEQGRPSRTEGWGEVEKAGKKAEKPSLPFGTPQDCARGLPGFTSLPHYGGYGVKRQDKLPGVFSTSYPLENTGIKHLPHRGPGLQDLQRNKDQGWMQEQLPWPEHSNSPQRGFSHPFLTPLCVRIHLYLVSQV